MHLFFSKKFIRLISLRTPIVYGVFALASLIIRSPRRTALEGSPCAYREFYYDFISNPQILSRVSKRSIDYLDAIRLFLHRDSLLESPRSIRSSRPTKHFQNLFSRKKAFCGRMIMPVDLF